VSPREHLAALQGGGESGRHGEEQEDHPGDYPSRQTVDQEQQPGDRRYRGEREPR
jgi:hypothetical protein